MGERVYVCVSRFYRYTSLILPPLHRSYQRRTTSAPLVPNKTKKPSEGMNPIASRTISLKTRNFDDGSLINGVYRAITIRVEKRNGKRLTPGDDRVE